MIFKRYQLSAKKRKHSFTLTFEDLDKFKNVPCNYCGEVLKEIGIDRIDNSKGYHGWNCTPCCITCNRMKVNHTKEKFLAHLEKIYQNMASKMNITVKLLKVI